MILQITTPGTNIGVKKSILEIRNDKGLQSYSPTNIKSIFLCPSASISTKALLLCMQHEVGVYFSNQTGKLIGQLNKLHSGNPLLKRRQHSICHSIEGMEIARSLLSAKFQAQSQFLRDLAKSRKKHTRRDLQKCAMKIIEISSPVNQNEGAIQDARNVWMGYEGSIARVYFGCLSKLLKSEWQFKGRSRRPALNPFNACLNYAYGILYIHVEKCIRACGFDPQLGIFHSDSRSGVSLVYDIIEPYRVWVDRVVFNLFSRRIFKSKQFKVIDPQGIELNWEARGIIVRKMNEMLKTRVKRGRRLVQKANAIYYDCNRIAESVTGLIHTHKEEVILC